MSSHISPERLALVAKAEDFFTTEEFQHISSCADCEKAFDAEIDFDEQAVNISESDIGK